MSGSRKRLSEAAKKTWADTKATAGKLLIPKADPNSPEYKAWKAKKMRGVESPEIRANRAKGLRADGTKKGRGFLGNLPRMDASGQHSSELSRSSDWKGGKEYPLLVPPLDQKEREHLLSLPGKAWNSNKELMRGIERKALTHARIRDKKGKGPFAEEGESPPKKKK